jgi:putative FmdB family regulatory protein
MPTYEYECTACGHKFEKFHSIKATPIKKCPECAKPKVKRLIGLGAGLLFKGSGFYITDYRSDSYNKSAKADSSSPATGDAAGKDAKPAADTAATPAAKSDAGKSESKPAAAEPKPAPRESKESKSSKRSKD